ncbi:unnamed protein product [Schistosoma curassoni]|nr:unnamed protein product [Schistosoma curassoni]
MILFVYPFSAVIEKEKTEKQLLQEIETPHSLKRTSTKEKNPLPTKEDIAAEKAIH